MRPKRGASPSAVRRAAVIARGPHACPHCARPTWTEPPAAWDDLRDFVARCDSCERPLQVRVDAGRVVRAEVAPAHVRAVPGCWDPVEELLDRADGPAFAARVAVAALAVCTVALFADLAGFGPMLLAVLVAATIPPAAMWAPALAALALRELQGHRLATRLAERRRQLARPVRVEPGRWNAWLRESRRRDVDPARTG